MRSPPLFLMLCALALPACADLCEPADSPAAFLGQGVGGEVEEFTDGQSVALTPAPQGGFGVQVVISTAGLQTEERNTAQAVLDVYRDDTIEGTFDSQGLQLFCAGPANGGRIDGQVVGFDPQVYSTNDDLLDLDGSEVELRVTVTDTDGSTAVGTSLVTINVGG